VFGSWERAKSVGQFGWATVLKDLGCVASKDAGTLELRQQWEGFLRSDPNWEYFSSANFEGYGLRRTIKGCLVEIIPENHTWRIYLTRSNNKSKVGSFYSSLASAKRAVRKMINQI
jgi:hypothetical protein